jgi:polar amino acid transport system permease protein
MRSFGLNDILFLIEAARWTILLSVASLFGGSIVGIIVCWLRLTRNPVAQTIAFVLVQIGQGVPPLIQLFLAYFGLALIGVNISAFAAASIALSFFAGVYLGEIWRSSVQSIPHQQWQAGEALALTRVDQLLYVILPQAVRVAVPPTVGFSVQLVKNSSLASVVGFVELVRAGQLINNATFQYLPVFGCICVIYFVLCFPLSILSRRLEKKYSHG